MWQAVQPPSVVEAAAWQGYGVQSMNIESVATDMRANGTRLESLEVC